MRRRILLGAAMAPLLTRLAGAQQSPAQGAALNYPQKPITVICPYAVGGSADQRLRQFGAFFGNVLRQTLVIENKAGAGGNVGTEAIARAKPDGYVIGMGNFAPLAVNPAMLRKAGFDPIRDLAPICLIERGPLVLMVRLDSPFTSVRDVIAAAKSRPQVLTFASSGIGGSHHLSGELFKALAGIAMTHVPYKGGAPAATDLIGGQVDMMFEQMYAAAPSIRGGRLRPLAITSRTRSPLFPDVPTMEEAGVPGFEVLNWQGLVAPAGTPTEIIALLNQVTNQALADPTIRAQMLSQGNELGGGTPAQFGEFIRSESQRWGKLVRTLDIKPE